MHYITTWHILNANRLNLCQSMLIIRAKFKNIWRRSLTHTHTHTECEDTRCIAIELEHRRKNNSFTSMHFWVGRQINFSIILLPSEEWNAYLSFNRLFSVLLLLSCSLTLHSLVMRCVFPLPSISHARRLYAPFSKHILALCAHMHGCVVDKENEIHRN